MKFNDNAFCFSFAEAVVLKEDITAEAVSPLLAPGCYYVFPEMAALEIRLIGGEREGERIPVQVHLRKHSDGADAS